MPLWLEGLDGLAITGVWEMVEELGDGDDYLIGARLRATSSRRWCTSTTTWGPS